MGDGVHVLVRVQKCTSSMIRTWGTLFAAHKLLYILSTALAEATKTGTHAREPQETKRPVHDTGCDVTPARRATTIAPHKRVTQQQHRGLELRLLVPGMPVYFVRLFSQSMTHLPQRMHSVCRRNGAMDTSRCANTRHFSGHTWSSSGKAPRHRSYRSQRHLLRGVCATSEPA